MFSNIVNIVYSRKIYAIQPEQTKLNLTYIFIGAIFIFIFLLKSLGSDLLVNELTNKNVGASLFCLLLIGLYFLNTCILSVANRDLFKYKSFVSSMFSIALYDIVLDYNLFALNSFEEPYLLRLLQWSLFLFIFTLPIARIIKGGKLNKSFSLLHIFMYLPFLLISLSTAPAANIQTANYFIVSVACVLIITLFARSAKNYMEELGYLFAIFLCLSPLNKAFQTIMLSILNRSDFWKFKAEILYFPPSLLLAIIAFAMFFALSLCNDRYSGTKERQGPFSLQFNFQVLLSAALFVLGIYPFPLYIYIQFILEK